MIRMKKFNTRGLKSFEDSNLSNYENCTKTHVSGQVARCAFTLAEMMVVLLVVSIVLACMAPVMTTKMKADQNNIQASPWRWSQNNIDAYFSVTHDNNQSAMIGQDTKAWGDSAKLIINNSNMDDMILFKSGDNVLGRVRFQNGSVRLGNSDNALPQNSVEVGIGTVSDSNSVAIGNASTVNNSNSVAIGSSASVNARNGVAMGNGATVNAGNSTAIGSGATVDAQNSIAIGNGTIVNSGNNIAMGSNATVNDQNSIAIGNASTVNNPNSVAVGDSATAASDYSTAVGANSNASGYLSIAIGEYAQATGCQSIALGQTHDAAGSINEDYATQARSRWSTAIGTWTIAGIEGHANDLSQSFQTAIGSYSRAIQHGAIAINGEAYPKWSIAIGGTVGDEDSSGGEYGIAIGRGTSALADNGIAIGGGDTNDNGARVYDDYAIAIGTAALNQAANGIALGRYSYNLGNNGIAIGGADATDKGARVFGNNGIAIGYEALAPTTGTNNTVPNISIGYQAMGKASNEGSVHSNIAIGNQALLNNTGSYNVAMGHKALPSNTGSYNIAMGYQALLSATGTDNIAIGRYTLFASKGNDNIAIGRSSCGGVQGSNKTCIGASSGPATGSTLGAETNEEKVIFLGDKNTTVYIPGNLIVNGNTTLGSQYTIDASAFKDAASDRRLKYVGKENNDGLAKLRQLKIFNYTYKKDKTKTPHVGVIAQDLQKIFPNAVKKASDGFLRIRMEDMFFALINAIKELDAKCRAQEKRINELEKRIEALEAKIK